MSKTIPVLALAVLVGCCAIPARGQNSEPQQWTFVATSESAPNALPLFDANGNLYACTGQSPDNGSDSNPNCYNPLVVTTDWTITTTLGIVTSASSHTPLTLTNSSCSTSSFVTNTSLSETGILGLYTATFAVTLDSGATITFAGNVSLSSTQFTGTFSSTGACMKANSGNFTATLLSQVNAAYAGQFETSSGGQGVTIALATDSNFNLTGTVTPASGANTCFSNMTIGTPLANSYADSFATGDTLFAVASDSAANVVSFTATNSDANGKTLASNGLYFTYYGVVGACAGVYEQDAPFEKVQERTPRHPPFRFGTRPWRYDSLAADEPGRNAYRDHNFDQR
jgi:hypothetical protein